MRTRKLATLTLAIALVAGAGATQPRAFDQDPGGFIYGTVETRSGNSYTGLLRWGTEEAFWDDLYNGTKDDLPYLEDRGREQRRRITVFGVTVGYKWEDSSSGRMLSARFGDIQEIRVGRGDRVELVMKSGSVVTLDGGSNDIGAKVTVADDSLGDVELEWKKIERIVFKPAPSDARPRAWRLYGTLVAEGETFAGYIQWDKQECLSTDKLDGETEDGEVSIEMGRIRRIERRSSSSSTVVLKDGRELVLRGTNDVNDENRGIYVEDERYGRVEVGWDGFEHVEFTESKRSGRGYGDYEPGRKLHGTVTDLDGASHTGELIFDLDETESWEILNGSRYGIEYNIPFAMIRSVTPGRRDSSTVVLRDGTELELEDGQDVSERNDGVVILHGGGASETYVAWEDVKKVEFH